MQKICNRASKSPLCNNEKMYNMIKSISDQYDVPMWLMLGIMSKESWFGTLWASQNTADCRETTYNRHWSKANNTPKWTIRENKIWYGCWLNKYDSLEEWTTSLARTIWVWYKKCLENKTPESIAICISYKYVWQPNISEKTWVDHVVWYTK